MTSNSISGSWYDSSVPDDYNNPFIYPGDTVGSKAVRMLRYLESHLDDFNCFCAFFDFVVHLSEKNSNGKYSEIEEMLMKVSGKGPDGVETGLVEFIMNLQLRYTYQKEWAAAFAESHNADTAKKRAEDKTNQAAGELMHYFLDHSSPVSHRLATTLSHFIEALARHTWDPWFGGKDSDRFLYVEDPTLIEVNIGFLASEFILGSNAKGQASAIFMNLFDEVASKSFLKSNPLILVMFLLFLMNDASYSDERAGFGDTVEWLGKRTNEEKEIQSIWDSCPVASPKDNNGVHFILKLEHLRNLVNRSTRLSEDVKKSLTTQFDNILKLVPYGCQDRSIQGMYDQYVTNLAQGNAAAVREQEGYMNDAYSQLRFAGDPGDARPLSPAFQTTVSSLKSIASYFTDQSQTQTTLLTQLSNDTQAFDNILNSFVKNISQFIQLLTQNQKPN
jgi:hypothetical protein